MPHYAFQAELYGLTQTQRTNGAAFVEGAFDQGKLVGTHIVDDNKDVHGSVCLFVEADFDSRLEGDRIHEIARAWASTRAEDAADGRHSYVRLREVLDDHTVEMRLAESPGWVAVDSSEQRSAG